MFEICQMVLISHYGSHEREQRLNAVGRQTTELLQKRTTESRLVSFCWYLLSHPLKGNKNISLSISYRIQVCDPSFSLSLSGTREWVANTPLVKICRDSLSDSPDFLFPGSNTSNVLDYVNQTRRGHFRVYVYNTESIMDTRNVYRYLFTNTCKMD